MDANPYGYTIPLALEDYVPVLLSGLGCLLLIRTAASRVPVVTRIGYLGVVLLVAGGASKATWKLIVASGGPDTVIDQFLFPLLSFGFTLVAWAVWSGLRGTVLPWWPFATLLAIAVIGAFAIADDTPLFGVAVLASLTVTILAITWAVRTKDPAAVVAFAVQLAGVFALTRLQSVEEQTLSLQWLEQSVNTVAQGAFAFGAWRVWRKVRASSELVMEGT